MTNSDVKESEMLNVCFLESATQDVRGRLFEQIVVARFFFTGLPFQDLETIFSKAGVSLTRDITEAFEGSYTQVKLEGVAYPKFVVPQKNITLYIPMAPNFPAVDMIFCVGKVVIAFQIHISKGHVDVLSLLQSKAEDAKWEQGGIQTIILVYLSPTPLEIKRSETKRQKVLKKSSASTCRYTTVYSSIKEFDALKTINWR